MSKGRINSEASMLTAARTFRCAGYSWAAVERAAHRNEDGVYVVRLSELARERNGHAHPHRH